MYHNTGILQAIVSMVMGFLVQQRASKLFTNCGKINLYAPCVLYIGQAFGYSPENAFYLFNEQIYFII